MSIGKYILTAVVVSALPILTQADPGNGKGNGHTHANLQSQIDNIQLIPGPEGPQGPGGADGNDGDASNCNVVLTQRGYDANLVKDTNEVNGSNANHVVNSCPLPYTRTGASCLASAASGLLRQAGTDITASSQLICRGSINSGDSSLFIRLRSYPICMKVELICNQ